MSMHLTLLLNSWPIVTGSLKYFVFLVFFTDVQLRDSALYQLISMSWLKRGNKIHMHLPVVFDTHSTFLNCTLPLSAEHDECATGQNLCDENAICTNTIRGHLCTCKPGYVGNGTICRGNFLPWNIPPDTQTPLNSEPEPSSSSFDGGCSFALQHHGRPGSLLPHIS